VPYTYSHPRPSLTTDILIFSIREKALQVLLIERKVQPFAGQWAIPGGFVRMSEDLVDGALRELAEEAGVTGVPLTQFRTYGRPDRDPRERVVTVVFMALVPSDHIVATAASDAAKVQWFPVDDLPPLAFDHARILADARQRLADDVKVSVEQTGRVAFDFLPEEFSLSQAQSVFETLRGEALDKRNFRKWILATWPIEETGAQTSGTGHRPAALYRLAPVAAGSLPAA
jgi:8-oxo-dGTP diphosphatase